MSHLFLRRRLAAVLLALAPTWALAQLAPPEPADAAASAPLTAGVPAPGAVTDGPIKGYAVVIGGALKGDNEDVWRRLVELSGGKGSRWVVFGTASQTPDKTARRLADLLELRGATAEIVPVAPQLKWVDLEKAVRDPSLLELVNNAQGIFFSGGAQERIIDTFSPGGRPTPMLKAIWGVYQRGGVIAGTSAGAAVMSTVMFRDALSVINVMKGQLRDGKEVDRGLGFVGPNLFVDQHFLKRGRFGRMLPLMMARGYKLGLGIDENSAAVVQGDMVEVIGAKGALLVDLREARTDAKLGAFNVQNARLTYLDRGDRYDLGLHKILPSARKLRGQRLQAGTPDFKPEFLREAYYTDMLGDSTIYNAMAELIDSRQAEARGLAFDPKAAPSEAVADLGFSFRLYKGKDSVGWYSDELGADEYTVASLYLDIAPVRIARPMFTPWTPR
ncbi:cyanophycinase [Ideonella sp. 4Y16]|uniref:Cyanophycinase n=1 Tax=Ideonella alba TaxID=2824118 RepID=A0A940Y3W0_9BURK|nr:cyanophycinase [Ideonella alba]MBQ0929272.1 cyanophycinase [Ideonella alba]MBQ0945383.1 cyanophycinase [Ideonella alba]